MVAELRFDAFDVDYAGELEVYLNGQLVASIPDIDREDWNEVWNSFAYDVSSLIAGKNEVVFTLGVPRRGCSIKNVRLTVDSKVLIDDMKTYTIADESPSLALREPISIVTQQSPLVPALIFSIVVVGVIYFFIR